MIQTITRAGRRAGPDPFIAALAEIRKLLQTRLTADERDRAGLLWYALTRLQEPLRHHTDPALASEIDYSRNGLVRRQERLRHEYQNLLEQCLALKWELYWAVQPPFEEPLGKVPPLKETGDGGVGPDFEALKQQIHRFLDQLEKKHAEADALVLENVTTEEIGAGD